jgi:hypothetical protein
LGRKSATWWVAPSPGKSPRYQRIRADPSFNGVVSESKSVAEHSTGEQERSSKDVDTRLVDHATTPQQPGFDNDESAPNNDEPAPISEQPALSNDPSQSAPNKAEPTHDNDQSTPTNTQPPNKSSNSKYILLFLSTTLLPFFLIFLIFTMLLIGNVFMAGYQELSRTIRHIIDGHMSPSSDDLMINIVGLLVVIAPMYFFFLWSVFARAGTQGS